MRKARSGCASRLPSPASPAISSTSAIEESQLLIRGRQQDDKSRQYLHRGIAARQFQRTFVLADGMEVLGADLKNGLLSIDLVRPQAGADRENDLDQRVRMTELETGLDRVKRQ